MTHAHAQAAVDQGAAIPIAGLAHITGDGALNLRRLSGAVGFEITDPLPVPGICRWLCEAGGLGPADAYRIFNMGCGFVIVVPESDAAAALALLAAHHPGAALIGLVTAEAGRVALPSLGVAL